MAKMRSLAGVELLPSLLNVDEIVFGVRTIQKFGHRARRKIAFAQLFCKTRLGARQKY